MSDSWFLIPTGLFVVLGAITVARVWPTWTSRLVVFGVVGFAVLVVACQGVGILAAMLSKPLVRPPWVLAGSGIVALVCWRVSVILRRRGLSRGAGDSADDDGRRDPVPALIVGAVALAILPHAVVLGLSAPPRGWDVLAYHLPRAVAWLQHGNLGHYGSQPAFYPGNGEIAMMLCLHAGSDRLVPIVQLPFALLGAVAAFGLARILGARPRSAAVPAVVFLSSPIVFFQSAIAKNDLIVAALVLSGAFLLCRALRGRGGVRGPGEVGGCGESGGRGDAGVRGEVGGLCDLVVSGLAFGLAAGSRYTVLPLVILTLPLVLVLRSLQARSEGPSERAALRSALGPTAWFAVAVAVPSAFWFLQNWIMTGNPLAPLSVGLGGWDLFSGTDAAEAFGQQQFRYVLTSARWLWFPWIDRAIQGSYSSSVGFGAAFAVFALPALLLSAWSARRGAVSGRWELPRVALLSLVVSSVAVWWFGGFHLPRYLLPAFALACVPIALLFDLMTSVVRRALVAVLAVSLAFSAVEALRVVYVADDLESSRKDFVTKAEHYHMPPLVYELPAKTKILLLDIPGVSVFRTFRYPVVGSLPGNEVVMMGDVGVETDLLRDGPVLGHSSLIRDGVDYVFLRTLALPAGPTLFDKYPSLYEKVLDAVEEPYDWYRKGYLPTPGDGFDVRAPAVTKMYRVLRR